MYLTGCASGPQCPPALPGGILEQDALMANDLHHNSMGHFGSDRKPRGNPTFGEPCLSLTEVLYVTLLLLTFLASQRSWLRCCCLYVLHWFPGKRDDFSHKSKRSHCQPIKICASVKASTRLLLLHRQPHWPNRFE